MADRTTAHRRLILACGMLAVAVAVIVGAGVIPSVLNDTHANARPQQAATAFGVSLGIHLLMAAILFGLRGRSAPVKIAVSLVLAFVMLLLGLALLDAGTSFRDHGPSMQTATLFMFAGAATDGVIAVLIAVAGFLRQGKADSNA